MELTSTQAIFLLTGILCFFAVLIFYFNKSGDNGRKVIAIFEEQARKRNGKVDLSSKVSGPRLLFPYKKIEIQAELISGMATRQGYWPGSTYIRASLPRKSKNHFQIYREGALQHIEKVLGSQDIRLGHDAFDREFMIKSNNEDFLRHVLTPTVQQRVLSGAAHNPTIEFNYGLFILSVYYVVTTRKQLEDLIEMSLAVIDQIREVEQ